MPKRDLEPRPSREHRAALGFAAVLACFALSGFAALIYETVWTRQFAFVFGTSELAVATVLAAYMAGLAAGAGIAGYLLPVVARPVLLYGLLEAAIALAALLVPSALRAATALATLLFGGRGEPPAAGGLTLALFYVAASFAILLVPTACMGATLPLLARFAVHRQREIGPRVGLLYASNTAGAVAGTWSAGFVLLPALGMHRTVLVGAAANGLVFVLAVLLSRAAAAAPPAGRVSPAEAVSLGSRRGVVLPLLLVSGTASFTYEVLWTRLLGHVLGGTTYAFATMLGTFLVGIALGSVGAARLAASPARAARGLAGAEIGVALFSLLAFRAMDRLPELALRLGAGFGARYPANAALAALVMVPAAICIGATFPFAVRLLARTASDAGPASARAYAWNTAGAIAGALGAGFFLMPLLGYAGIATAAVAANLVLAVVAALLVPPAPRAILTLALLGLVALAAAPPGTPWRLVGTSPLSPEQAPRPPIFFAVGRSASVGIAREKGVYRLRTNGLPEGTVLPRGHNQKSFLDRWLGALPSLARPEARTMLVVGLGGGSALEAVSRTLEQIDVVELEREVITANRVLGDRRARNPLADPRLRLYVNDARGALQLTSKRWDAIVSQPSHPWTVGASHLYTREFFALVRDHLSRAGVFVQWIGLELVDESLLRSLLATLLDVFPNVRVYRPFFRSGLLFIASGEPLPIETTAADAIAASPETFAWAGVQTAEDVAAALTFDEAGARRFAAAAPLTTDDDNRLQLRSVGLATPLTYQDGDRIVAADDPLPALSAGLDRIYLIRRLLADWDFPRAARLVEALADPVERLVGSGLVALTTERATEGVAALQQALRRDSSAVEARVALVRAERNALLADDPAVTALAAPLADPAAAVVAGWPLERGERWGELRDLEPRLAAAAPHDPIYPDALRLRARWRIESGDLSRMAEAATLLDHVWPIAVEPADLILRARASLASGIPSAALCDLAQALDGSMPAQLRRVAASVRDALGTIPESDELADIRGHLESRTGALLR